MKTPHDWRSSWLKCSLIYSAVYYVVAKRNTVSLPAILNSFMTSGATSVKYKFECTIFFMVSHGLPQS